MLPDSYRQSEIEAPYLNSVANLTSSLSHMPSVQPPNHTPSEDPMILAPHPKSISSLHPNLTFTSIRESCKVKAYQSNPSLYHQFQATSPNIEDHLPSDQNTNYNYKSQDLTPEYPDFKSDEVMAPSKKIINESIERRLKKNHTHKTRLI